MTREYYIISNDQRVGPFLLEELASQQITPTTLVWKEGMQQWCPAREVEEVRMLLALKSTQSQSTPQQQTIIQVAAPSAIPYQSRPVEPPSYLVWSILVTIFCCLVGGLIAIIYSAKVPSRYSRGDYEGANRASRTALGWIVASITCGAIGGIIYLIL